MPVAHGVESGYACHNHQTCLVLQQLAELGADGYGIDIFYSSSAVLD